MNIKNELEFFRKEAELSRALICLNCNKPYKYGGLDDKLILAFEEIQKDIEHQKEAIKVEKDRFNFNFLKGDVTPYFILRCSERIDKEVVKELLDNIIFTYINEETKFPLMFYRFHGAYETYVDVILSSEKLKLNDEQLNAIIDEMCKAEYNDINNTFILFLKNNNIPLKYKEKLVLKLKEIDSSKLSSQIPDKLLLDLVKAVNRNCKSINSSNKDIVLDVLKLIRDHDFGV